MNKVNSNFQYPKKLQMTQIRKIEQNAPAPPAIPGPWKGALIHFWGRGGLLRQGSVDAQLLKEIVCDGSVR